MSGTKTTDRLLKKLKNVAKQKQDKISCDYDRHMCQFWTHDIQADKDKSVACGKDLSKYLI